MGEESVTTPKGQEWEKEFADKVAAVRNADEETEEPVEFGFRFLAHEKEGEGTWIATVPDWGNIKQFIHRVAAEARYEGAKGCAEATEIARPHHAASWDAEDPIGRAKAETLSFCSEKMSKAAQEYANSLKPKT